MSPTDRREDRVVLVTGAGGAIGAAIAVRAAAQGARVHCTDIDEGALARVAAKLQADGGEVATTRVDQSKPEEIEALFAELRDRYGRVDVCCANAGLGRFAPFLELSLRIWQRQIDVNLTGTFLVVQAAARLMADAGNGGSIVVTSSSGAVVPPDLFAAYSVAKAGLNMLVRSTAAELGVHSIRINAVMPGVVEGGMADGLLTDVTRAAIESATPLGRNARPEEVAAAAWFLAGHDAGFVTGTSLLVDGGQTIHAAPQWFAADARRGPDASWAPYGGDARRQGEDGKP